MRFELGSPDHPEINHAIAVDQYAIWWDESLMGYVLTRGRRITAAIHVYARGSGLTITREGLVRRDVLTWADRIIGNPQQWELIAEGNAWRAQPRSRSQPAQPPSQTS